MKAALKRVMSLCLAVITVIGLGLSSVNTALAFDNEQVGGAVVVVVFYVWNPTVEITQDGRTFETVLSDPKDFKKIGWELDKDGSDYGMALSNGTGFFVGDTDEDPEYLVTNYHVVSDYVESDFGDEGRIYNDYDPSENIYYFIGFESCEMRVYYDEDDYEVIEVVDYEYDEARDGIDLALCQLDEPTDKRHALKLCEPTDSLKGQSVYALGYPGISESDYMSASKWSMEDATLTTGTISRIGEGKKGVERLQTDAKINHGNSGGPLVLDSGYVVGVNTNIDGEFDEETGKWVDNDTRGYAISTKHVMELLDKNDVDYEIGDPEKDAKAEAEKNKGFDPVKFFNDNMYIFIGVGAGIVVLIIVIIIISSISKKKAKAKDRKEIAAMIENAGVDSLKPIIKSMSQQHNGLEIHVGTNVVRIGREPGCMIKYSAGTPGVSGNHAEVRYDKAAKDFIIKDLGSTYGTFLGDGSKLEPNKEYHIKAGETFYVGEKKNIIRVEMG